MESNVFKEYVANTSFFQDVYDDSCVPMLAEYIYEFRCSVDSDRFRQIAYDLDFDVIEADEYFNTCVSKHFYNDSEKEESLSALMTAVGL